MISGIRVVWFRLADKRKIVLSQQLTSIDVLDGRKVKARIMHPTLHSVTIILHKKDDGRYDQIKNRKYYQTARCSINSAAIIIHKKDDERYDQINNRQYYHTARCSIASTTEIYPDYVI